MLAQSPEPEAHDNVLDNNPDQIGIWKCWFLRRRENQSIRRKTSWSKEENQQQTQPTWRQVRELNLGHIGGRRALSPLWNPCSTTSLSNLFTFDNGKLWYMYLVGGRGRGHVEIAMVMVYTGCLKNSDLKTSDLRPQTSDLENSDLETSDLENSVLETSDPLKSDWNCKHSYT